MNPDEELIVDVDRDIMRQYSRITVSFSDEAILRLDPRQFRHQLSRLLNRLGDEAMAHYEQRLEELKERNR